MFPQLFANSTLPALEQVVNFSQARHEVLAGNIANVNTPGYRVRDLSTDVFQQRLREALQQPAESTESASPGMAHSINLSDDRMREVRESMKNVLFHDDSNLNLESQVTELAKNQMMHNLAITLMNTQFSQLQAAISERV